MTLGNVLAATSAADLGLIKVALGNSFWLFRASLDCLDSCRWSEGNPTGDVNELWDQMLLFHFTIFNKIKQI